MVFINFFFFPEKKKKPPHILHSWYKNKNKMNRGGGGKPAAPGTEDLAAGTPAGNVFGKRE